MQASRYCAIVASLALASSVVRAGSRAVARPGDTVLVVTTAGVGPYAEALKGLREKLGSASLVISVAEVGAGGKDDLKLRAARERPRVIVAIGGEAAAAVAGHGLAVPLIGTMVLQSPASPALAATVTLRLRLPDLIAELKRTFPGKTRLGILGALRGFPDSINLDGFHIRHIFCSGPDKLMDALLAFKQQVDFVYCPPEPELYNPTTVKPLILASLRYGIPLIGFSESFARAGAAASVYPDFEQVGRQTAEAVERVLEGRAPVPQMESPRKLRVAINEHVTRLLGLRHVSGAAGPDLMVIR